VELDFIAFVVSFLVVVFFTPSLIKVAELKGLKDKPDQDRKIHRAEIPTIGGIMIFAGTLLGFNLCYPSPYVDTLNYLTGSILILFFVGIKDDIIGTDPMKKLAAQILVSGIMVVLADVRLKSLHGVFHVQELPYWVSISLSLFTFIVVINAFNLIDGVDGLAGGVGLIGALFFGIWFLLAGNSVESCLCFSLAGSLAGFLGYNFSPARIFMGDSGSLTIGLIMSYLAIRLIEYPNSFYLVKPLDLISKPSLVIALLFYPLTDTLRIFLFRIFRGRSPFSADRNHIHHRLLDAGFTHLQTVFIIYTVTLISVVSAVTTMNLGPSRSLFVVIVAPLLGFQIPYYYKTRQWLY